MRTTICGSYPKITDEPGLNWRTALNRFEAGQLDPVALEEVHRATLSRILREQEEAGLDLLTDGQLRAEDAVSPLLRDVAGLVPGGLVRFYNNNTYYRRPRITGRLRFLGSSLAEEYREARYRTTRPVKAILPGPYTFATLCQDETYGERGWEQLLQDAALVLRLEAQALVRAGAPVVQWDEPGLLFAPKDHLPLAQRTIELATAEVAAERVVAVYFRDPSPVLPTLAELPVEWVALDMVEGPGLWDVLAADGFPRGVVLGLVDGRDIRREDVAALAAQVERVARTLGSDRVDVSTNTGLEFVPHAYAREKLQRLVEVKRLVEGGLGR